MSWPQPQIAEVAGRINQALAKMIQPHAVHQNACDKGVLAARQMSSISQAPPGSWNFWIVVGQQESGSLWRGNGQVAGADFLFWLSIIAAMKQMCQRLMVGDFNQWAKKLFRRFIGP